MAQVLVPDSVRAALRNARYHRLRTLEPRKLQLGADAQRRVSRLVQDWGRRPGAGGDAQYAARTADLVRDIVRVVATDRVFGLDNEFAALQNELAFLYALCRETANPLTEQAARMNAQAEENRATIEALTQTVEECHNERTTDAEQAAGRLAACNRTVARLTQDLNECTARGDRLRVRLQQLEEENTTLQGHLDQQQKQQQQPQQQYQQAAGTSGAPVGQYQQMAGPSWAPVGQYQQAAGPSWAPVGQYQQAAGPAGEGVPAAPQEHLSFEQQRHVFRELVDRKDAQLREAQRRLGDELAQAKRELKQAQADLRRTGNELAAANQELDSAQAHANHQTQLKIDEALAEAAARQRYNNSRQTAGEDAKRQYEEALLAAEANAKQRCDDALQKAEAEAKRRLDDALQKADADAQRWCDEALLDADENAEQRCNEALKKADAAARQRYDDARQRYDDALQKAEAAARQRYDDTLKRAEDAAKQRYDDALKRAEDAAKQRYDDALAKHNNDAEARAAQQRQTALDEALKQAAETAQKQQDAAVATAVAGVRAEIAAEFASASHDHDSRLGAQAKQLQEQLNQIQAHEAQLKASREQVDKQRTEYDQLALQFQSKVKELETLNAQIASLRTNHDSLKAEAHAKLQDCQGKLQALQSEVAECQHQLKLKTEELLRMAPNVVTPERRSEYDQLQGQVDAKEAAVQSLKAQIKELKTQHQKTNDSGQAQLNACHEQLEALQAQVAEANGRDVISPDQRVEYDRLKAQAAATENTIQTLRGELVDLATEGTDQLNTLQTQLNDCMAQLHTKKEELVEMARSVVSPAQRNHYDQLQAQLDAKETELGKQRQEYQQLQSQSEAELGEQRQKYQQLQSQLTTTETELDAQRSEVARLTNEAEQRKKYAGVTRLTTMTQALEEKQTACNDLTNQLQDCEKEVTRLRAKLNAPAITRETRSSESLRAQLTTKEQELYQLQGQLQSSKDEIERLQGQIQTKNDELGTLQDQLQTAANELGTLRVQLQTKASELKTSEDELQTCKQRLQELNAQLESGDQSEPLQTKHQDDVADLTETIAQLNRELTILRAGSVAPESTAMMKSVQALEPIFRAVFPALRTRKMDEYLVSYIEHSLHRELLRHALRLAINDMSAIMQTAAAEGPVRFEIAQQVMAWEQRYLEHQSDLGEFIAWLVSIEDPTVRGPDAVATIATRNTQSTQPTELRAALLKRLNLPDDAQAAPWLSARPLDMFLTGADGPIDRFLARYPAESEYTLLDRVSYEKVVKERGFIASIWDVIRYRLDYNSTSLPGADSEDHPLSGLIDQADRIRVLLTIDELRLARHRYQLSIAQLRRYVNVVAKFQAAALDPNSQMPIDYDGAQLVTNWDGAEAVLRAGIPIPAYAPHAAGDYDGVANVFLERINSEIVILTRLKTLIRQKLRILEKYNLSDDVLYMQPLNYHRRGHRYSRDLWYLDRVAHYNRLRQQYQLPNEPTVPSEETVAALPPPSTTATKRRAEPESEAPDAAASSPAKQTAKVKRERTAKPPEQGSGAAQSPPGGGKAAKPPQEAAEPKPAASGSQPRGRPSASGSQPKDRPAASKDRLARSRSRGRKKGTTSNVSSRSGHPDSTPVSTGGPNLLKVSTTLDEPSALGSSAEQDENTVGAQAGRPLSTEHAVSPATQVASLTNTQAATQTVAPLTTAQVATQAVASLTNTQAATQVVAPLTTTQVATQVAPLTTTQAATPVAPVTDTQAATQVAPSTLTGGAQAASLLRASKLNVGASAVSAPASIVGSPVSIVGAPASTVGSQAAPVGDHVVADEVMAPASNVAAPTSNVGSHFVADEAMAPASNVAAPTSNVGLQANAAMAPASNVAAPTSNVGLQADEAMAPASNVAAPGSQFAPLSASTVIVGAQAAPGGTHVTTDEVMAPADASDPDEPMASASTGGAQVAPVLMASASTVGLQFAPAGHHGVTDAVMAPADNSDSDEPMAPASNVGPQAAPPFTVVDEPMAPAPTGGSQAAPPSELLMALASAGGGGSQTAPVVGGRVLRVPASADDSQFAPIGELWAPTSADFDDPMADDGMVGNRAEALTDEPISPDRQAALKDYCARLLRAAVDVIITYDDTVEARGTEFALKIRVNQIRAELARLVKSRYDVPIELARVSQIVVEFLLVNEINVRQLQYLELKRTMSEANQPVVDIPTTSAESAAPQKVTGSDDATGANATSMDTTATQPEPTETQPEPPETQPKPPETQPKPTGIITAVLRKKRKPVKPPAPYFKRPKGISGLGDFIDAYENDFFTMLSTNDYQLIHLRSVQLKQYADYLLDEIVALGATTSRRDLSILIARYNVTVTTARLATLMASMADFVRTPDGANETLLRSAIENRITLNRAVTAARRTITSTLESGDQTSHEVVPQAPPAAYEVAAPSFEQHAPPAADEVATPSFEQPASPAEDDGAASEEYESDL